jgi:UDP-N-acetylmuramoyl-L-alanyl-D-glutamate--2,6-diaminopimelate ligase
MSDRDRTLGAVAEVLRSADLLTETLGSEDVIVSGVCQDSRRALPGDLFLAWRGTVADAHDFIPEAVRRGAVATIVEHAVDLDVPQLVVTDGRIAAALASATVMGVPSKDLVTIGVTGTNGKTTTAVLIGHLLEPDLSTAVIGTLGLIEDGRVRPGTEGLTTPGPVQIAIWLRELADGGKAAVVMEASSHALEQHRLDGVGFDVGVFTNLTRDHLDYHGDFDRYLRAKARLVELVEADGDVVVNGGDPAWAGLEVGGRRLRTYAIEGDADLLASELVLGADGSAFTLTVDGARHAVRTPLLGRYNVENALAAIGAALAASVPLASIIERLATAPHVSGRLEAVVTSPFTVLVDFAHTPAALEGALAAIKPLTAGRLIVVFGAGGDRDRTKRRPMAEAVRAVADVIVLTNDNPRTEDPERILDDVAEGLRGSTYERFVDRRDAIRHALEVARPGDTVVLTGKGHETYQTIGTEKLPFDERAIVRDLIAELGIA